MIRRSIGALIVGFVVLAALSIGTDALMRAFFPKAFNPSGAVQSWFVLVATIAYTFAFGAVCSYVTAWVAGRRPIMHATILGFIVFGFALVGTVGYWQTAPPWYHISVLAFILPSAWLGGQLRKRQLNV